MLRVPRCVLVLWVTLGPVLSLCNPAQVLLHWAGCGAEFWAKRVGKSVCVNSDGSEGQRTASVLWSCWGTLWSPDPGSQPAQSSSLGWGLIPAVQHRLSDSCELQSKRKKQITLFFNWWLLNAVLWSSLIHISVMEQNKAQGQPPLQSLWELHWQLGLCPPSCGCSFSAATAS